MSTAAPMDLLVFGIEVAVLVGCSLVFVYSLVVHRRRVLYRSGVAWLTGTLLLFTVGAVVEFWGLATGNGVLAVVAFTLYTAATAAVTAAMWVFARGFIRTDDRGEQADHIHVDATTDTKGGFEDAGE